MPSNHYHTLQISASANAQEIKLAYRRLAIQYHPDKNPGDATAESKFKEIAEAYDILSDTDKKYWYDRSLLDPMISLMNAEAETVVEPESERPVYVRMTVENSDTPYFYWKMAGFILLTIFVAGVIGSIAFKALSDFEKEQKIIYLETKQGVKAIHPDDPLYQTYQQLLDQVSKMHDSTQSVDFTQIDSLYQVLMIE